MRGVRGDPNEPRKGAHAVKAAYRRLVVKLSGEQLAGDGGFGISPTVIEMLMHT